MKICVFEDKDYSKLYPLTYLRAAFELRCGHTSILEKIKRKFDGEPFCYFVREELKQCLKVRLQNELVNELDALRDDLIIINGKWLVTGTDDLQKDGEDEVGISGETLVYARVKAETVRKYLKDDFWKFSESLKSNIPNRKEISSGLISFPWDLISGNAGAIKDDFDMLPRSGILGEFSPQAAIYGDEDRVYAAKSAKVHPFVVLDTSGGPIIIDEGVIIYPFTRIEGPACIGKDSQIFGAKVREGTSIGPVCRVGGEVEESILHGYSNKFHDGFLGHSYVCEWVNLGALTTNSDLKNDYSNVQVYINGELTDTNQTKVGCFIGDHTKTSIGTFFNTGTIVGVMSNLVGSGGVLPKLTPSFVWFVNNKALKGYGFRMSVKTAEVAMSRRDKKLTEDDRKLLEYTYRITKSERDEMIKKGRM